MSQLQIFLIWLEEEFGLTAEIRIGILLSLAGLIILWLARAWVIHQLAKRIEDPRSLYFWRKTTQYIYFALSALLLILLWLRNLRDMATYLGLLSAGLAIALKEPLTNIFGWLFIVWRRPFGVGDRIQIGEMAGDVIDVRVFQFSILEIGNWVESDQSTGRIVHIPNGKVFIENLANYTSGLGLIWNEIPVKITLESDWRTAKNRMLEIAEQNASRWGEGAEETIKKASNRFMIFYSALTPTVYTSVGPYSVTLTLRYLCDPRQRRISEAEIWEEILKLVGEQPAIDLAYPTQRFYDARLETRDHSQAAVIDREYID